MAQTYQYRKSRELVGIDTELEAAEAAVAALLEKAEKETTSLANRAEFCTRVVQDMAEKSRRLARLQSIVALAPRPIAAKVDGIEALADLVDVMTREAEQAAAEAERKLGESPWVQFQRAQEEAQAALAAQAAEAERAQAVEALLALAGLPEDSKEFIRQQSLSAAAAEKAIQRELGRLARLQEAADAEARQRLVEAAQAEMTAANKAARKAVGEQALRNLALMARQGAASRAAKKVGGKPTFAEVREEILASLRDRVVQFREWGFEPTRWIVLPGKGKTEIVSDYFADLLAGMAIWADEQPKSVQPAGVVGEEVKSSPPPTPPVPAPELDIIPEKPMSRKQAQRHGGKGAYERRTGRK